MFIKITFKKLAAVCAALTFAAVLICINGAFLPSEAALSTASAKLIVIMYHQVSDNSNIFGDYVIPPSLLEKDFIYMKEHGYNPVDIDTLADFCKNGTPLPEKAVLITFDDGQRSFLTKVVPLLEKYGFPAVVAVIGSLAEIYSENGDTDDRYAYLNKADIKALSENGLVEIADHSYNMHSLSGRRGMGMLPGEPEIEYREAVTADIRKNQALLKNCTGVSPRVLAYPYGIRNDILFEAAKNEGISVTLTCRECVNNLTSGGSLYELGRFNRPYKLSSAGFFEKISRQSP